MGDGRVPLNRQGRTTLSVAWVLLTFWYPPARQILEERGKIANEGAETGPGTGEMTQMNDTPRRAFGSSAKAKRRDVTLDLPTARQMLPLVMSIVRDIVDRRNQLTRLHPEQENLDQHRRDLSWSDRERRYHVQEEIVQAEGAFKQAVAELRDLGVALVDGSTGRVAFPTRINGRPAVFTWQPGEDSVQYWSYEDEDLRRPIPNEWVPGTPLRLKK
jgi:hypothetical protein